MRELDRPTGKPSTVDTTMYRIASRGGASIEGPAIARRGGHHDLFAGFDHVRIATADLRQARDGVYRFQHVAGGYYRPVHSGRSSPGRSRPGRSLPGRWRVEARPDGVTGR